MRGSLLLLSLMPVFLLLSCEETPSPKPRGYHRISFPDKSYLKYEGNCPYAFEYPVRSLLDTSLRMSEHPCWMNLHYPQYGATVHLTYQEIDAQLLPHYIEDSRKLAMKHVVKANDIKEVYFEVPERRVFGVSYDFEGNTATNFQFFVTDSSRHFLRGSMYFNMPPNYDSLAPVANFIKEDLRHLLASFSWD